MSTLDSRPDAIKYATHIDEIDGKTVHSVYVVGDRRITTDCGREIPRQSIDVHSETPAGLSGTLICYDCVRNYSGDLS